MYVLLLLPLIWWICHERAEFSPPGALEVVASKVASVLTGSERSPAPQPSGGLKDGMVGGTGALSGYDLTIGTIDALCKYVELYIYPELR
jgi:hypothetical protein